MISQRFLKWKDGASVSQRAAAASALGRAYLECEMDFNDRCGAEAAMTLLLDDASPKIRGALADALASSRNAPPQIIAALARDQFDIAALVIARSPVLSDHDIEPIVATACEKLQVVIARRPTLSNRLARSLAKYGAPQAAIALLDNINADVCRDCLTLLVERLGNDATVRGRLLDRKNLPVVLRYRILRLASQALAASPLLLLGGQQSAERADRMTNEHMAKQLITLIDQADDDLSAFVEELRLNNDLTTTFLLRSTCFGKIDFVAHVLADLSGEHARRVTNILAQDRTSPLRALLNAAGLSDTVAPIFVEAIGLWRQVAQGSLNAGPQEVTFRLSEYLAAQREEVTSHANDDILALLRSIYLDTMRDNARHHAIELAKTPEPDTELELLTDADFDDADLDEALLLEMDEAIAEAMMDPESILLEDEANFAPVKLNIAA